MSKTYDAKCHALAESFLLDESGISKDDLIKHTVALAGEIQQLIEDYIEFDYRRAKPPPDFSDYNKPFCHTPEKCGPQGRCLNQDKTGFACNH